ncbi:MULTISPECIES: MFS transporter [Pseudomonas]|uniref:MFS transporter n=1 Tax=Pseudomonas putida TaxID=303 RepID=A0A7U6M1L4_PSEPU|nr:MULTISPECIES: MFS transporter [Pseudomonas]MBH3397901.1 MFS transporter [Pseudomonas monteilii]MDD2123504.1 MFS transporter [Pseudomonas monteilii]SNB85234.1 Na+/melibiose symporter [Pseudomonas sp. URIL14HWK12:I8]SNT44089.1 Na+/melibiose symporter [Pseudomonas sp. LAMO17WK12:I8]SNY35711.1 Na+/melibiose symporter [Pseudomonas sp. LAMO17WK12:I11]
MRSNEDSRSAHTTRSLPKIPRSVWALGFVSMFMDISSEMIHALLPLYMVTVLGTSVVAVGVIEGIAEATASITKVFSGALSDRLGKRKLLTVLGYGLAALTKPVFPIASGLEWLTAARFVDRVGKGIRGAPRDALVADVTPAELRGAAFGLRQALDTVGAFLGPLLAIVLMWLTASQFQTVFWVAVIPAFVAVYILIAFVREPETPPAARPVRTPLALHEMVQLGSAYWRLIGLATLFTLARFSEAFLLLRAQDMGLAPLWAPAVLVLMALAYSLSAYPAGVLSDRVGRRGVLMAGLGLLIAADLLLALLPGWGGLALGVAAWGLHLGFSQGVFAAMIADSAPANLRGTAFGLFNLLTGVALLAASVVAGLLWDGAGFQATFLVGAGFAGATLAGLALLR